MNTYKTLKIMFTVSLSLGLLGFLCQIIRRMKKPHSQIASSSSSSSNPQSQDTYQVFLSFSGETRNSITSLLDKALCDTGIFTFLDDKKLRRGEDISSGLENAIKGSRCSVVVLSPKYASSRWCMDELVNILRCRNDVNIKQIVLPIFFHVNPDHILKNQGSIWNPFRWFGGSIWDEFRSLEAQFRHDVKQVESWRAALIEVATIAGHPFRDGMNVAKFIEDFIKVVSSNLGVPLSNISNNLVKTRLEKFKSCVSRLPIEDVRFIGICGMRGIGKTTLARAYFDDMSSQFERSSSFLANVRQVCEKEHNGLEKLQEQLLTDILIGEHKVKNVNEGIGMISQRLRGKKVLVILDDVDQVEQLQGLAEKTNWFGSGSRIILTTTDERLLSICGVEEYIIHKVDILEDSEALQLFSSKAFRSACPPEDYKELSEEVMKYAKGLPLALVVLGSFFRRISIDLWRSALPQKKEEVLQIWRSALDRLKVNPNTDIMKVLQISFDTLTEETEKSIFLDIACFFNGDHKDHIMKIMDSCGLFPEIGIRSLMANSLLYMDHDDTLRMHDLLEEMGKKIVQEKSSNEPGRRSRIWRSDDFYNVMNNDTGTEEVEAIVCGELEENFSLRGFSNMKKLRLLIIDRMKFRFSKRDGSQNLEYLSNDLRFLHWDEFPLNSFPPSFQPYGLVELKLWLSEIKQLWNNSMKPLTNLKSIDLSCSTIRKLEGFILFPYLEELILDYCHCLEEIDPSITVLQRLTLLSLKFCKSLQSLPPSMAGLKSLKVLTLNNCFGVGNVPEDLWSRVYTSEELAEARTSNRDTPSPTRGLELHQWKNILNTIVGNGLPSADLCCLEKLDLGLCEIPDGAFPDDFGCLASLEYLDLSYNDFSFLPAGFNRLYKLRDLDLSGCENLTALGPELPDSLEMVSVNECSELHTFLDPLSQCNLRCSTIFCVNCFTLVRRQGSKRTAMPSLGRYLQKQNPPSPKKRFDIVLPGNEISSWFTHQVGGSSSISLPLDPNWCTDKWMGFALSVCFTCVGSDDLFWEIKINQEDWGSGDVRYLSRNNIIYAGQHLWLLYLPRDTYFHTEWHNKSGHIQFSLFHWKGRCMEFIRCGVRLVYERDIEELNQTASLVEVFSD